MACAEHLFLLVFTFVHTPIQVMVMHLLPLATWMLFGNSAHHFKLLDWWIGRLVGLLFWRLTVSLVEVFFFHIFAAFSFCICKKVLFNVSIGKPYRGVPSLRQIVMPLSPKV